MVTFGVNGTDRRSAAAWDPEVFGDLVRDKSFDAATVENQVYLLNLCSKLRNSEMVADAEQVSCWIEEFHQFLHGHKVKFPVPLKRDFYNHLAAWSHTPKGMEHAK